MSLSDKNKKRLKFWFLKMPIFIGLFIVMMIAALKLVERYPEPLKEGFEKYLSERTNTRTTVERLEKAAFYPNIDIRLHNLTMHRVDNAALIDMEADKFFVSVPLSGLFVRQGKINLLDVENFKAVEGVFTPFAFDIKMAHIKELEGPEQYGSFIVANGFYGNKAMHFEAEIEKKEDVYIIPKNLSFSLGLGRYEFNATTRQQDGNIILSNAVFQKNDQISPPRDYILVEKNHYRNDNPLACLYQHAGGDSDQCDQYLK